MDTPVEYPMLTVPGKGDYRVKFGMGAMYTLEAELNMDPQQFSEEIRRWLPKTEEQPDGTTKVIEPGRVGPRFLFTVLSACLKRQGLNLSPGDLADCFEPAQLPQVAKTIAEAFSKTQWSTREPMTPATTARPN